MRTDSYEDVWREASPHVLAALVRRYGDFEGCEDAVQEALLAAARQWPTEGLPENPRGWLVRVASRRLIDARRADTARAGREVGVADRIPVDELVAPGADEPTAGERDDSLALLLLCCHPALSRPSQVALTLRAVAGLGTDRIARAFLVPEATMAQRISRAKARLREVDAPFAVPPPAELPGPGGGGGPRALPRLHGGSHRDHRQRAHRRVAGGRGGPAHPAAARAPPRRGRGRRAARADAADRRAPARAHGRGRGPGPARGAGPLTVGPRADRGGGRPRGGGPAPRAGGPLPAAGGHRRRARRGRHGGGDGLGADRGTLRDARRPGPRPGRDAQPGRRRGRDQRARGRACPGRPAARGAGPASHPSGARRARAPARAGPDVRTRPERRTPRPPGWPRTSRSSGTSRRARVA